MWRVLGTMSGTSCDGLDLVLLQMDEDGGGVQVLESEGFGYPESLQNRLRGLGEANETAALELERDWTLWVIAKAVDCRDRWSDQHGGLDLMGFSGHTWFHEPGGRGTRAIGDAALLRSALGLPVVADYRSADVAAGGQGAPLVPLFDAMVFGHHAACANLGGIANVTLLSQGETQVVRAWDVCGCNLLLNRQAQRAGRPFDEGGVLASQGQVDLAVLAKLQTWPYLHRTPPKSLAAEDLSPLHLLLDSIALPEDAMATAVEWMAQVLARSIMLNGAPGQILVTGGGAHHGFLLKRWSAHLGNEWKLDVPSALWIDGKEAAAFAWLAQRTALGKTTSLASVTGATRDVCGGVLFGNFAAPGMNGK